MDIHDINVPRNSTNVKIAKNGICFDIKFSSMELSLAGEKESKAYICPESNKTDQKQYVVTNEQYREQSIKHDKGISCRSSNLRTTKNGMSFEIKFSTSLPALSKPSTKAEQQAVAYNHLKSNTSNKKRNFDARNYLKLPVVNSQLQREHSIEQDVDIPCKSSNLRTTKNGMSFEIKFSTSLPVLSKQSSTKEKLTNSHQKQNFDCSNCQRLPSANTRNTKSVHSASLNECETKATVRLNGTKFSIDSASRRGKHRTLKELRQKLYEAAQRRLHQKSNIKNNVSLKVGRALQNRLNLFASYRELTEKRLSSRMKQCDDRRRKKILSIQRKAKNESMKLKVAAQNVKKAKEKILENYLEKLDRNENIKKLKNKESKQRKRTYLGKDENDKAVGFNSSCNQRKKVIKLSENVSYKQQKEMEKKQILILPSKDLSKQQKAVKKVTSVIKKDKIPQTGLRKNGTHSSTLKQNEVDEEKPKSKPKNQANVAHKLKKPWKFN